MHPLLEFQLQQHGLDPLRLPAACQALLVDIDAAYQAVDEERTLREQAMSAMLDELVTRNHALEEDKEEQKRLLQRIADTQQQLLQTEKLASIGQLAAGVAHEINNPVGFVLSNMRTLERYLDQLWRLLDAYDHVQEHVAPEDQEARAWLASIEALKGEIDYAYLREDIPNLFAESLEGLERVRKIVQDLKDFSRSDRQQQWEVADLRHGLDATLNIVHNEIKYRAEVVKEYGEIPLVECVPSQINQVFLNLLVNAAQAMPEGRRGVIRLRCGQREDWVWIEVADDGCGIPPENLKRIFDPFFTTKPVGKGTGLGLSLAHGIIERHHGRIEVESEVGRGTTFRVWLPIEQPKEQSTSSAHAQP